jgi:hypothetical protein
MARVSWAVEIAPGSWENFGCFMNAQKAARKRASRFQKPVLIQYRGGGKERGNRDLRKTDFLMHPNGHREPEIDPTWWTNCQ